MAQIIQHSRKKSERGIILFVIISLFLHFAVLWWMRPEYNLAKIEAPKKEIRTVVQLIKRETKQVVDTNDDGEKKIDPRALFMGKEDMSFKKQTIAKNIGSFKKGGAASRLSAKQLQLAPLNRHAMDLLAKSASVHRTQGKGEMAVRSDHIDDIPLGDLTQLNTSAYRFYGFLERFKKQMEGHWRLKVREFFDSKAYGRIPASQTQFATDLVISLDAKGQVIDIDVDRSSGVQAVDEIAISAIYRAGSFPNPPQEMVVDGKITIPFGFVLNQ